MFIVYFLEGKNVLLNQLRNRVPSVGEDITIKGRKGKVTDVQNVAEKKFHVQVTINKIIKNKAEEDKSKKKKR
ncbi:hypothetical protein [Mesobacillus harenae]|uniref:hypothetical protein n=1 Tax=Mesobacillus harenae TaxID=2213203 RepID=UPI00158048D1|nr:hypothetical protein [Mesobacillus harenae]